MSLASYRAAPSRDMILTKTEYKSRGPALTMQKNSNSLPPVRSDGELQLTGEYQIPLPDFFARFFSRTNYSDSSFSSGVWFWRESSRTVRLTAPEATRRILNVLQLRHVGRSTSCRSSAQQMGFQLSAHSSGPGQGAIFCLKRPVL